MYSRSKPFGIVVGVDGSPASKVAVDWAAREASLRRLPLTLVHAAPGRAARRRARRIIDDAIRVAEDGTPRDAPPQLTTAVMPAAPVETLVTMSRKAEMIVVGSRRRSALRRTLSGSVSPGVVHGSHCPVAVIHDEDPLMPHPAQAPVLAGVDGSAASMRAARLAREEASRRGVELVLSEESATRFIEQSDAAQLVVVSDGHNHRGAALAQAARMPVIVAY